jgi:hypothetical protein
MAVSPEDLRVIDDMKQREFAQKKRRRAASAMNHERRRYRALVVTVVTIIAALVVGLAWALLKHALSAPFGELWHRVWPALLVGAVIGWLLAELWFGSAMGKRYLARKDARLNEKYSGDLHAGRRWQQFFYKGE